MHIDEKTLVDIRLAAFDMCVDSLRTRYFERAMPASDRYAHLRGLYGLSARKQQFTMLNNLLKHSHYTQKSPFSQTKYREKTTVQKKFTLKAGIFSLPPFLLTKNMV